MRYTRNVLCCLVLLVSVAQPAYALDWKRLHDASDTLTVAQARQKVVDANNAPEARYVLALTCLYEYKNQEAQEIFTALAQSDPDECAYQWGLAEMLRRDYQIPESKKILEQVIARCPQFPSAHMTLAYIKFNALDFNGAVASASKVAHMPPSQVDTSNLVRAYMLIGGAKGMIAHYGGPLSKFINGPQVLPNIRKAQKLKPDNPGVYFGLGCYYFLAPGIAGQNTFKAIEYFKKAVEADPMFADAYVRLAQAYRVQGDVAEYENHMRKALELEPKNILALDAQSGECKFLCRGMEDE